MLRSLVACGVVAGAVFAGAAARAQQDSAVINFIADLDTLTATNLPDPLAAGPLAFFASIQPDVLRLDGQIWIPDYTGDGVYTAGFNNVTGNRILVHSPLLERIEAQTWRAEDASDFAGTPGGPVEISGTAVSQRTKWLLPDDTPNGVFTVEVVGGQIVDLEYAFDFSANSGLLFTDPNEGSGNPNLSNIRLDAVDIDGGAANFAAPQVFAAGSAGFLDAAFGLNTQLSTTSVTMTAADPNGAFSPGTAGSTVGNTTIGQLLNEINNNTDELGGGTANISNDGRRDGAPLGGITNPEQGAGYLADIFAATTGDLFVFTSTADLTVSITVTQVPEPAAGVLLAASAGCLAIRRRR
ncbi:MAG: PEP-CTERM sorting domain-containing protein [Planctomycetota bacterium]